MSPCIYYLSYFQLPSASQANLGLDSPFTKVALHNPRKEGSPSSPNFCIPAQHQPPGLFCAFMEDSGYLSQEIAQICPRAAVLPNYNCAMRNPTSLQLDWTMHCIVPIVSQSLSSLDYSLCSLGSRSPNLPDEIAQPS